MNDFSSDKIEKCGFQRISNYFGNDDSTLSTDINISYSSSSIIKVINSKIINNNNNPTVYNNNKESNNYRLNYYYKLISKGNWNPKREKPKNNSLIIFDWDDTLLCTTFISNNNYDFDSILKNPNYHDLLYKLEDKVFEILSLAIQKGETYIITNAEKSWVEYTSQIFFPSILNILNHIKIISAREENQFNFPNEKRMWKINSFNHAFKKYDYESIINIISIGDSFFEVVASKLLNTHFYNSFIKTVQFIQTNKIEELISQIDLVINKFDFIVNSAKNYTINVNRNNPKK